MIVVAHLETGGLDRLHGALVQPRWELERRGRSGVAPTWAAVRRPPTQGERNDPSGRRPGLPTGVQQLVQIDETDQGGMRFRPTLDGPAGTPTRAQLLPFGLQRIDHTRHPELLASTTRGGERRTRRPGVVPAGLLVRVLVGDGSPGREREPRREPTGESCRDAVR